MTTPSYHIYRPAETVIYSINETGHNISIALCWGFALLRHIMCLWEYQLNRKPNWFTNREQIKPETPVGLVTEIINIYKKNINYWHEFTLALLSSLIEYIDYYNICLWFSGRFQGITSRFSRIYNDVFPSPETVPVPEHIIFLIS